MTATDARRRYLVLLGLRWLPQGMIMPVFVLAMQERGLDIGQVGLVIAAQSAAILVLEVPSGALADALGRRRVAALAAAFHVAALALFFLADRLWLFAVVWLLQGVFRALDSGALEAWFVDAAAAADPRAPIERGLSQGSVVIGLALAGGSLAGGLAPLALPVTAGSTPLLTPLTLPILIALACAAVHLAAVHRLMRAAGGAADAPAVIVQRRRRYAIAGPAVRGIPARMHGGVMLALRTPALAALLGAELLWGVGMVSVELLWQPRAVDLLGDPEGLTVALGTLSAGSWMAVAVGASLFPVLAARMQGAAGRAALLRLLHGLALLGLAAAVGPLTAAVAFVLVHLFLGASDPSHRHLLHRSVPGGQRATMLSLNSLGAHLGGLLGKLALLPLAGFLGVPTAWAVAGLLLTASAPLYLVAGRGRPAGPTVAYRKRGDAGVAGPPPIEVTLSD